jgi:hypothetical protein
MCSGISWNIDSYFSGVESTNQMWDLYWAMNKIHHDTSLLLGDDIEGYSKNWPGFIGEFFSKWQRIVLECPADIVPMAQAEFFHGSDCPRASDHHDLTTSPNLDAWGLPGAWKGEWIIPEIGQNFSQPLISWGYHPKMGMTFPASRIVKLHCSRVNVHVCLD